MPKVFIDTNILICASDFKDPTKRERASAILRQSSENHRFVVSTQIMQEFYVAATRKLNMPPAEAKRAVESMENLEVVTVAPELVKAAIDCSVANVISFWDALVVACAQYAGCDILWTEDLNTGQKILGVRIENPLK